MRQSMLLAIEAAMGLLMLSGPAHIEAGSDALDINGDYDILGKLHGWQTPRLDIWLNEGPQSTTAQEDHHPKSR
jgi:hypothetical protein